MNKVAAWLFKWLRKKDCTHTHTHICVHMYTHMCS